MAKYMHEARRLADEPITLETLADEFGVSRERVRQIEVRAFEKVHKAVQHRGAAMERAEPTWIAQLNEVQVRLRPPLV